MKKQINLLIFYDCRKSRILIEDQIKGLISFIKSKAEDRKIKKKELIF